MSAINFLPTAKKVEIQRIKPLRSVETFSEAEKEKIELWLAFCCFGVNILNTGTKMLSHLNVIHSRNAVFDLINEFAALRKYFEGSKEFDTKEREIDDFVFTFLISDEQTQKRVMKFQESIIKK